MADIEIEYLPGEDDHILQCRGHVDPEAFCQAVMEQEDVCLRPVHVRHTYLRFIPDGPGGRTVRAWECDPGRGAFPVTVAGVR